MDEIYQALKQMRLLSDQNVPFTFSFVTCNRSNATSKGIRKVARAKLRRGFSKDKSKKSVSLIGYVDLDTGANKWFYLPLLISFNNQQL